MSKKLILISMTFFLSLILSGCAGLFIAGGIAGASSSQDRRTFPTQLEDENIELKATTAIFEQEALWKDARISVVSFNGVVLLVGQTPTAELKQRAENEVRKVDKITKIHNQLRIAAPISFIAARNDDLLTTKVKSAMLLAKDLPSNKIKVVTENSEVFLMGIVTLGEAELAVKVASEAGGVTKVVKVFEYIH